MIKIKRIATEKDLKNLPYYNKVIRKHNLRFGKIIVAADADADG